MIYTTLLFFTFFSALFSPLALAADDKPLLPEIYLNGKIQNPTVQELGGIGTRPLRLLVEKNNKAHGDELIQVYAMGTREGDYFRIALVPPAPGTRVTLYKLIKNPDGDRFFTLPISIYYGEKGEAAYHEKIAPYISEYLIIAFEQTESPGKKSNNQLYFEERARNLAVKSIKPNIKLSSLKLKMKDVASQEKSFTYDAQELIDRFINPQRIFVVRLWKDERVVNPAQDSL